MPTGMYCVQHLVGFIIAPYKEQVSPVSMAFRKNRRGVHEGNIMSCSQSYVICRAAGLVYLLPLQSGTMLISLEAGLSPRTLRITHSCLSLSCHL